MLFGFVLAAWLVKFTVEAGSVTERCIGASCDDGACDFCSSGWASRCELCSQACAGHPCATGGEDVAKRVATWAYGMQQYSLEELDGKFSLLWTGKLNEDDEGIDVDGIRERAETFVSQLARSPPIPKVVRQPHTVWSTMMRT